MRNDDLGSDDSRPERNPDQEADGARPNRHPLCREALVTEL
jgi:hypothetical protein